MQSAPSVPRPLHVDEVERRDLNAGEVGLRGNQEASAYDDREVEPRRPRGGGGGDGRGPNQGLDPRPPRAATRGLPAEGEESLDDGTR